MNDKLNYWIEEAEYDLKTAELILETKRFLYIGFFCHLALEKMIKAEYVVKFPSEALPPKIFDLVKLAKMTSLYDQMPQEQKDFIVTLELLNKEALYPTQKADLFSSFTNEGSETVVHQTKELFQWIKAQL